MAFNQSYENLSINNLINTISTNLNKTTLTFDEFKNELLRKNENNEFLYNLSLKEDDNLCMLFGTNNKDSDVENSFRSIIIEKKSLKPIVSQYNRILYNADSLEFLKDKDWKNSVTVQKCYEGTLIVVFNYENKWYVTTRRCLDAQKSEWVKNTNYYSMFTDAMKGKFDFEKDLNKDYCYHFVLVHYRNKNIVSYSQFGKEYKEVFHILTTEKYTMKEVDYKLDGVNYIEEENFESLEALQKELEKQNELDKKYQKITTEGYVLRYYKGEKHNSPFVTLKLQTEIYETLMKLKPNNSNIYQCFLELYQNDKLNNFLPYFSKYSTDIIRRIHSSMKTLSKEFLDLYHTTRNKNNQEIYNKLTTQYKKSLYEIHGLYIKNRTGDFNNGVDTKSNESVRAINVFDVYNYLKNLPANELRQIFFDRMNMINLNVNLPFINKNCIHTTTQTTLMFKNLKNNKQMTK